MGSSSDNSYFRLKAFSHDGDISRQLREIHAPGSWLDCKACPLLVPPRLLISAGVRRGRMVSAGLLLLIGFAEVSPLNLTYLGLLDPKSWTRNQAVMKIWMSRKIR